MSKLKKVIELPLLDLKVKEGTIVAVYKQVGDHVDQDEVLYDVESSKAVHEVESPVAGTVTECLIKEGDVVSAGDRLMEIEVEADE